MTDSYEVYSPGADTNERPSRGRTGRWQVVIEHSNEGQARPPTVVNLSETQHPDRESALAAAKKHAFEFNPPDPFSPQGRQVFGDGPDGFLVVIQGAMTVFHMSVRVVRYVGKA